MQACKLTHMQVKDTREEHLQAHFTREDYSQLFHAGDMHSGVSCEWDVASGRYRIYYLKHCRKCNMEKIARGFGREANIAQGEA